MLDRRELVERMLTDEEEETKFIKDSRFANAKFDLMLKLDPPSVLSTTDMA
jgi:hypothetical protein